MVSCNPATAARDMRILVDGGYAIERIVPIDQFLFSPHIELVALLRRSAAGITHMCQAGA
jgi:23S rRNA (uracil1939-C5)-methyltransferase